MYPHLYEDILSAFEKILGPEVHAPIAENYRSKLRSTAKIASQAPTPNRKTPRFLRVIATPDDDQGSRLKAEWKGDVAVLRWSKVQEYVGSASYAATTEMVSVP